MSNNSSIHDYHPQLNVGYDGGPPYIFSIYTIDLNQSLSS